MRTIRHEQTSSLTSIRPSYPLCDSPSNRSVPHFHLFRHEGLWKPKSWKTCWNMLLRATAPRMNRTCTDARILKAANLQGVAGRSQMWSGFSRKVCPSAAAIEGNFSRLRARPAHLVGGKLGEYSDANTDLRSPCP